MPLPRNPVLPTLALALLAAGNAAAQTGANAPLPPLDRANMDTTYGACQNFYLYANGGWLKNNPVPAAYSTWSSFNELTERNQTQLREVLDRSAREAETTSDPNTRKLGRFYGTCMDSTAIEAAGIRPIQADLQRIAAISTRAQLQAEFARAYLGGAPGAPFGFGPTQDPRNASQNIANVSQGGLGLPNRDYYFKNDSASVALRARYLDHVAAMFALLGQAPAAARADAQRVLALETALAGASMTPVQLRNPNAQVNPMTLAELDRAAPGFSWSGYVRALGLANVTSLNVSQPEFMKQVGKEVAERPLDDWKAYMRWRLVNGASSWLPSRFVQQQFRFTSALTGAREMQPRWRRCLRMADGVLGDALGREYVKTAFTPEAKTAMMEMVHNLRAVFGDRIRASSWMSDSTKTRALAKLGTTMDKVGYPDKWEDYSSLEIGREGFLANLRAAGRYGARRSLDRIGKPVDRDEWYMTPPTVNAYYNPTTNEIGFPAGRLQPPFFHASYDLGANYGGIGGTIGHEMTHGFDDEGRKYDAQGNLTDWWTAEDGARFEERARLVDQQYSAYTVLDSLHVNGQLTMGENIADIGGMSIAYYALQRALEGKPRTPIDGFTPEQRFFLAYAQARRSNFRPEQLRLMVQTDPHSPNEFRVNGPLSNMPEFAQAFGCKPGDPMVRPENLRAHIW
jgi:putative endopeptidase